MSTKLVAEVLEARNLAFIQHMDSSDLSLFNKFIPTFYLELYWK
jgi:hypothetical protein